MKLTSYGAAEEVTGSCHLIEVANTRVLLDCGLIQGRKKDELRNHDPFPFNPAELDAVVLSHAHIDHCGRLPMLLDQGFKGKSSTLTNRNHHHPKIAPKSLRENNFYSLIKACCLPWMLSRLQKMKLLHRLMGYG